MSLWIVIYIYAAIGGTVGPLPYDRAECARRIAELQHDADKDDAGKGVRFACEFHKARPEIDVGLKP